MKRTTTFLRNVTSNWAGFALNSVVTLILTPFVVEHLGIARYGIWMLTLSVVGYYGFLDLGFRAGLNQFLTRYVVARDYLKASECISSAIAILSGLGLVFVAISIVAAFLVPQIFTIPVESRLEAIWCILIVGISSGFQIALSPFATVFAAAQRFDLANLIGVATRLLTASAIYAALRLDYGLIGISAATCGLSLVDYLLRWHVSIRLVPELKVDRRYVKAERVREITSFGLWNFLTTINSYITAYMPAVLIGLMMPVAAVGQYALATGLWRQINSLLSPVVQVVYPITMDLHVNGNSSGLQRLYHDGSRLIMLVMAPIVLLAAFWADDFYRLWIGEKYLTGTPFLSVSVLLRIMLISTVAGYTSAISQQILVVTGRIREVSIAQACGSVINIALSAALVRPLGLAGVALAFSTSSIAIDLIVIPLLLSRDPDFSIRDFLWNACPRPLVLATIQALLMVAIRLSGQVGDWPQLIIQGVLAASLSATLVVLSGLNASERRRFLITPWRHLRGKMRTAT